MMETGHMSSHSVYALNLTNLKFLIWFEMTGASNAFHLFQIFLMNI